MPGREVRADAARLDASGDPGGEAAPGALATGRADAVPAAEGEKF